MPLSVYVIENDDRVRAALCLWLDHVAGILVVGNSAEIPTSDAIQRVQPDLLLLGLPSSLIAQSQFAFTVRKAAQITPIVALVPFIDEDNEAALLSAGVEHVLLKSLNYQPLRMALRHNYLVRESSQARVITLPT